MPVTIGNVIGGAVMVGVVYWFVYLRGSRSRGTDPEPSVDGLAGQPPDPVRDDQWLWWSRPHMTTLVVVDR